MGVRFSAPVQTGPGPHPVSCTMGTGSFPGVNRPRRGAEPRPHLQCRGLKLGRAIPLPALRPLVACIGRTFTLHTINSNSRISNYQFSLFSEKNPVIRILCIFGWLAVPISTDKWSSTVCNFSYKLCSEHFSLR